MTIRVETPLIWRVEPAEEPDKQGRDGWVAFCDALDICTAGDSLDELHAMILETMDLLVQDLLEDGEVEHYLRLKNVEYSKDDSLTPAVHVPWQLVAAGQDDFERAAA